jgi:hypothetical protein
VEGEKNQKEATKGKNELSLSLKVFALQTRRSKQDKREDPPSPKEE